MIKYPKAGGLWPGFLEVEVCQFSSFESLSSYFWDAEIIGKTLQRTFSFSENHLLKIPLQISFKNISVLQLPFGWCPGTQTVLPLLLFSSSCSMTKWRSLGKCRAPRARFLLEIRNKDSYCWTWVGFIQKWCILFYFIFNLHMVIANHQICGGFLYC